MVRDKNRVQAPGNGNTFDSPLFDNGKQTQRTMGCLGYLAINEGCVSEHKFISEIKPFLHGYYEHGLNQSNTKHFIRPLIFLGLVESVNDCFCFTPAGKLFYEKYEKGTSTATPPAVKSSLERECCEVLITQFYHVRYPNEATVRVEGVSVYPFRCLFYYLCRYNSVSVDFLEYQFPYITTPEKFREDPHVLEEGQHYQYFNIWVISSLCALGVLFREDDKVFISPAFENFIRARFGSLNLYELFHTERDRFLPSPKANQKIIVRNKEVRDYVLKRDNYTDRLTGERFSFLSRDNNQPICDLHHLIPMEKQEYYRKTYNLEVDAVDNTICVSPNTHSVLHRAMHSEEYEDLLKKSYSFLSEQFKNVTSFEEFKGFYLNPDNMTQKESYMDLTKKKVKLLVDESEQLTLFDITD